MSTWRLRPTPGRELPGNDSAGHIISTAGLTLLSRYGIALLNCLFGSASQSSLLQSAAPSVKEENGLGDNEDGANHGGQQKKMKFK